MRIHSLTTMSHRLMFKKKDKATGLFAGHLGGAAESRLCVFCARTGTETSRNGPKLEGPISNLLLGFVGCRRLVWSRKVGYEPEGREFESLRARHFP